MPDGPVSEDEFRSRLLIALADATLAELTANPSDSFAPLFPYDVGARAGLPNTRAWLPRAVQGLEESGFLKVVPIMRPPAPHEVTAPLEVIVTKAGLDEAARLRGLAGSFAKARQP